jgi:hypothetical protein
VLAATDRRDVGQRLTPAEPEHAWRGRHLSAGWGVAEELELRTVKPDLVAECVADTAVGRYRHPVRFVRLRDDLTPREAPPHRLTARPKGHQHCGGTQDSVVVTASFVRVAGGSRRWSRVPVCPGV